MIHEYTLDDKVWIISDFHFFHTNVIKYSNRPFSSVEEMNNTLISNWNKVVGQNDKVYHLGDWIFGHDKELRGTELSKQLNGDIWFLPGNHDKKIVVAGKTIEKEYLIITYNDYKVALTHFPETIIKESYNVHCYGHVHNNPHDIPKNGFNCSVENINYTPILLSEIINKVKHENT